MRLSLATALAAVFSRQDVSDVANKLVHWLLSNKYVSLAGRLFRKADSFSTGDRIATDAANIHRSVAFSPLLAKWAPHIQFHWAYVDDTCTVLNASVDVAAQFVSEMNAVDPEQSP